MKQITYALIDSEGLMEQIISVPAKSFVPLPPLGYKILVVEDGVMNELHKIDMNKLGADLTIVKTLTEVVSPNQPAGYGFAKSLDLIRVSYITNLDNHFKSLYDNIWGPLKELHKEKRKQALDGNGPLIKGDSDRQAILDNGAKEDSQIAYLEDVRRHYKTALRQATSEAEMLELLNHALAVEAYDDSGI